MNETIASQQKEIDELHDEVARLNTLLEQEQHRNRTIAQQVMNYDRYLSIAEEALSELAEYIKASKHREYTILRMAVNPDSAWHDARHTMTTDQWIEWFETMYEFEPNKRREL